ncbi:MAG: hypothetical protein DHS20C17_30020 [Cyclobacteriaceae bacterium]|nr:MAG: hypothetical protein DHS20C17_30020 [Cyclobacteriaceae bacterium]
MNALMGRYLVFLLLLVNTLTYGATCTTTSTTTWSCGTPGQNDDLIVNHNITITGDFTVNNGSITVNSPNTLTITGNLTFNNNSTVLVNDGGCIHVMGNFLNRNNSGDVEIFGTLNIDGNFQNGTGSGNGAVIDIDGTGSISYGGTCSNAGTVTDDDGSYSDDCDNPVLPVELLNFRGTATEFGNLLEWETASERNNDFFAIERSADTQNWEKVGSVIGNGNSDLLISYQFLDASPIPGRLFYRLKQVDYDGAFEYSYIISLVTGELPEFQLQKVYPIPTPDLISISYITNNEDPVHYKLIDNLGRNVNLGIIVNQFGSHTRQLTLSNIPPGGYLLVLTNKGHNVAAKVIKSK